MNFPTSPKPNQIKITSVSPSYVSTSQNLRQVVTTRNAHRWGMEVSFAPMTRETAAPLMGFVNGLQGQALAFNFTLPSHYNPQGLATGTPRISGGSQTGKNVESYAWTASSTILKAGDFVHFDGSYKMYMITEDITSNASGEATLKLNTPLVASPANDATIYTTPVFRMALNADNVDFDIGSDLLYGLKLQMKEVLY